MDNILYDVRSTSVQNTGLHFEPYGGLDFVVDLVFNLRHIIQRDLMK